MAPPSKRARSAPAPCLPAITGWLEGAGVWYDPELLEIQERCSDSGSYLSIVARQDLKPGSHLCTIPKDACLSTRNASCAAILEEEELLSGLGLVMAVMHERLLGKDSRWHGYFASIPEREYLPVFWTPEELAGIKGTELEMDIEQEVANLRADYEEQIAPLCAKHGLEKYGYSFERFQAAASLVASRAFKVDDELGDAMVPLADIFNHKASVVALSSEYEVFDAEGSDDDSSSSSDDEAPEASEGEEAGEGSEDEEEEEDDDDEGSVELGSDSEEEGSASEEEGGAQETNGIDLPRAQDAAQLASGAFLADAAPTLHGMARANGLGLALEICIVDDEEGNALRILAASAVAAGREVHNTYGELGNRDLVEKYGFALLENPHTSVTLELEPVWAWARERLPEQQLAARRRFLEEQLPFLLRKPRRYGFVHALPNAHLPAWAACVVAVLAAEGEGAWERLADVVPDEVAQLATGPRRHRGVAMSSLVGPHSGARDALKALVSARLETLRACAKDVAEGAGIGQPVGDQPSRAEHVVALEAGRVLRCSEIAVLESFLSL